MDYMCCGLFIWLTLITLSDRTKLPIEAVIIEMSMATGLACVKMYYLKW